MSKTYRNPPQPKPRQIKRQKQREAMEPPPQEYPTREELLQQWKPLG